MPRTLTTALHAIRRNTFRSILTTLGIVMGIGAVIAMMEIGQGSATAIQKTISSMGANRLIVIPGSVNTGGVHQGSGSVVTLTPTDCDAIMRECPAVIGVAPFVRARTQVVNGNRNWVPGYIGGTTPQYLQIRNWTEFSAGCGFTDRDVADGAAVCIMGQTVATNLFGDESPVGKDVRIQGVAFRVLGVLSPKGANMFGNDQDDLLLAPWTTIKYRVSSIGARVANQSALAGASSDNNDASTTVSNTASASILTWGRIQPVSEHRRRRDGRHAATRPIRQRRPDHDPSRVVVGNPNRDRSDLRTAARPASHQRRCLRRFRGPRS